MSQQYGEGAITADGSEQTIQLISQAGNYILNLDTANLVLGDAIIVRAKKKIVSGGSLRLVWVETLIGAQTAPAFVTDPLASAIQCSFTIEQVAGTNRVFPYSIDQVG